MYKIFSFRSRTFIKNRWNFDGLATILPKHIKSAIWSTLVHELLLDTLIRASETRGTYSVRTTYNWLSSQTHFVDQTHN